MEVWSNASRTRVVRDLVPANEKIHWSVVERLGRKAIVDEKISKTRYAPANLETLWSSKKWREEDRPLIERDPRVAAMSEREEQFIDLCRRHKNARLESCALACPLKDGPGAGMLERIRDLFSTDVRRDRRRRQSARRLGGETRKLAAAARSGPRARRARSRTPLSVRHLSSPALSLGPCEWRTGE